MGNHVGWYGDSETIFQDKLAISAESVDVPSGVCFVGQLLETFSRIELFQDILNHRKSAPERFHALVGLCDRIANEHKVGGIAPYGFTDMAIAWSIGSISIQSRMCDWMVKAHKRGGSEVVLN